MDLGTIANLIAAAGVIASLLYLSRQIRQNTDAVRASSYQAIVEGNAVFMLALAQDAAFTALFIRGSSSPADLTPEEQVRFSAMLGQIVARFDLTLHLHQQRFIDADVLETMFRMLEDNLKTPGGSAWWRANERFCTDQFRRFMEPRLARATQADPPSRLGRLD
ncbi:MAG TPA: hypothetical protein VKM54_15730 [Myxococcota bacterium]|nr:hypothetical protein [Myxococcota bacterium]